MTWTRIPGRAFQVLVVVAAIFLLGACSDSGQISPYSAPNYMSTSSAAVAMITAQAASTQNGIAQTAMAVEAEATSIRLQEIRRAATLQAVRDQAAMASLTPPTPTSSPIPTSTPIPSSTPVPTSSPTPDREATRQAVAIARGYSWGGLVFWGAMGLVFVVGMAFLIGAVCNHIEKDSTARRIEAEGSRSEAEARAYAIRLQARADVDRKRHMQVVPGFLASMGADGKVLITQVGQAEVRETSSSLPMPAPIARMALGRPQPELSLLSPFEQKVITYLKDCADKVGMEAQRLPSAAQTNNNGLRQPVINALVRDGLAISQEGTKVGGTWLGERYPTVGDLLKAVSAGEVHVQPEPEDEDT